MKYTVLWVAGAEQELAALWLDADQRAAITRASHLIDQRLMTDPQNEGESRPGGRRILFEPPLGATYVILSQEAVVRVLHVWRFRKRGQQP
jgi:hypothetical protein